MISRDATLPFLFLPLPIGANAFKSRPFLAGSSYRKANSIFRKLKVKSKPENVSIYL